jgi:hypothetical protein
MVVALKACPTSGPGLINSGGHEIKEKRRRINGKSGLPLTSAGIGLFTAV